MPNRRGFLDAAQIEITRAAFDIPVEGTPILVTASFGVAAHVPDRRLDSTIADADRALYRAKEEGRDRLVVHDTPA